jgi:hypothetical protein
MERILTLLPFIARAVLWAQKSTGVTHPTWVGTAAEWIIRGDRRTAPDDPGQPPTALRRAADRVPPEPPEAPGGGP